MVARDGIEPPTPAFSGLRASLRRASPLALCSRSTALAPRSPRAQQILAIDNLWWPGTESNRRRQPFQGCGLPFEGLRPSRFARARRRSLRAHPERSRFWRSIIYGGQGRNRTADASLFRAAGFPSKGFAPRALLALDGARSALTQSAADSGDR